MTAEPLGIAAELAANRLKYARYAYVAPHDRLPIEPSGAEIRAASARLAELLKQITARERELDALGIQIATKKGELAALTTRATLKRGPQISEVQEVFCNLVREAGYEIENRPYTFNDLVCKSNQHPHIEPRHVCIDLVRRLTGSTLMEIARGFGYRDHTSVKHALGRYAEHMAKVPALADVHAKVLAQFGAKQ